MKKIFHTLVLLVSSTVLLAQSEGWQHAERITDTIYNHTNATMYMPETQVEEYYYLFWERQVDGQEMEICMKPYYSDEELEVILSDEDVNYRNPQIMSVEYFLGMNSFILVYESDKSGSWNIYANWYQEGAFTSEVQLTNSDDDDNHMRTSKKGVICWANSGNIYSMKLGYETGELVPGDITLIAEGNCTNPVINSPLYNGQDLVIAWEKHETERIDIELVRSEYPEILWGEVELFYEGGNNTNLKFSKSNFWSDQNYLSWDHEVDGIYQAFFKAPDGYDDLHQVNTTQSTAFMPDLFPVMFIVKELEFKKDWFAGLLTYAYSIEESNIYSNQYPWDDILNHEHMFNLSDSTLQVNNPSLFEGRHWEDYFLIHNIWEVWQNNHWVLYHNTNYALLGDAKAEDKRQLSLTISPNPASDNFNIEFDNPDVKDFGIKFFDISGRKRHSMSQAGQSDKEMLSFNKHDLNLETGLYMIKIQVGNSTRLMKKLILR